MYKRMMTYFAELSSMQVFGTGMGAAAVMELITVALRFGLGMEYSQETQALSWLTLGVRVHHGMTGLLVLVVAYWLVKHAGWRNLLIVIGMGMVISDAVHHLVVLWALTGSPQFDLLYPNGFE